MTALAPAPLRVSPCSTEGLIVKQQLPQTEALPRLGSLSRPAGGNAICPAVHRLAPFRLLRSPICGGKYDTLCETCMGEILCPDLRFTYSGADHFSNYHRADVRR